jgi:hypothetical protein
VVIVTNESDIFELKNEIVPGEGNDAPTLLLEAGKWKTERGNISGISVSVFGDVSPLISPTEARKLAKWLQRAADELEGAENHKPRAGTKPSHYEQDDET